MKEILIASGNAHKIKEFREMLEPMGYQVKSLKDLDQPIEIDETGTSFEENSMIKAMTLHKALGCAVMADDSGLMVDAMDGAPGVYSARFMGENTSYDIKNQYIIDQVKGKKRDAQFVCVISYVESDSTAHSFKGVVHGEINDCILGEKGFGYDPIFYYPPYKTTLANVSEEMKNAVSHRGIALRKCVEYMKGKENHD
ncbi:MAG: RdgB/HAM1 family non-canonical purine NTP pyrophosphatase [Traorella sp.]